MDTFETAKSLISEGCFMACIDLKDAYYSVSIQKHHRKFLKFTWMDQLWQYKALPNGLTTAPRLFTKLLKPVLATLRRQNHTVMAYLDDILIIGHTSGISKVGSFSHSGNFSKNGVYNPSRQIKVLSPHRSWTTWGSRLIPIA